MSQKPMYRYCTLSNHKLVCNFERGAPIRPMRSPKALRILLFLLVSEGKGKESFQVPDVRGPDAGA